MSLIQQLQRLGPGRITTIAGVGYREGVPARDAPSGWTLGVVRLPGGDLVVADYKGNRLWRIDGDGILHTFAGDGVPGDEGDGGPAIDARVYGPHDLALDRHGNLYFSDLWNNCYRRIDGETGVITRIAGSGRVGRGGTGGPAVDAEIDTTSGIAIDERATSTCRASGTTTSAGSTPRRGRSRSSPGRRRGTTHRRTARAGPTPAGSPVPPSRGRRG